VSSKDRLGRLRQLVARLEQLPDSPERERMLAEVRARAVDLETGVTPRAMLPVEMSRLMRDEKPRTAPAPAPARRSAPITRVEAPAPRAAQPASPSIDLLANEERLSLEESSAPHRAWQHGLRG
jgi:pyruvate/2-oxoglutarate dehydrogenase complex dihydrolipoamide acyltransferase (E2) component